MGEWLITRPHCKFLGHLEILLGLTFDSLLRKISCKLELPGSYARRIHLQSRALVASYGSIRRSPPILRNYVWHNNRIS